MHVTGRQGLLTSHIAYDFVFVGQDEHHHDISLINEHGKLVTKKRIQESVEGWHQLLDMLAAAGDAPDAPIPATA